MKQANILTELWYISVHGGDEKGNNLLSFDTGGKLVSTQVLDTSSVSLRELRGFVVLEDESLLVANAHKGEGKILHFGGASSLSRPRPFQGTFSAFDPVANPGLLHPFSVRIGPDGNLYVSNQGCSYDKAATNGATRYVGPDRPGAGEPTAIPQWWVDHAEGTLFPGTVVPASKQARPGVKRIRDLIFGPDGFLYVADEKRNEVRRYDGKTLAYVDSLITGPSLDTPVHLLLSADGKYLFIGSEKNDSVLRYDVKNATVQTFVQPGAGGLHAPAGMALDRQWLYVCSRKGYQVLRFRLSDGSPDAVPFIHSAELGKATANAPEFIAKVSVPGGASFAA